MNKWHEIIEKDLFTIVGLVNMRNTSFIHTGNEKSIEYHFIDNIHDISKSCFWGDIIKFENQLRLDTGDSFLICDIMIWHNNGTGTIVEVKKYKSQLSQINAIGQILLYGELIKFKLGEYPRMVICSDYISVNLLSVLKSNKLPIKALELDGNKATYY